MAEWLVAEDEKSDQPMAGHQSDRSKPPSKPTRAATPDEPAAYPDLTVDRAGSTR